MGEGESLARVLQAGQISRRQFIGQATLLGLSTPAILAVLDACSGSNQGAGRKSRLVVGFDGDIDTLDPNDFKSDAGYLSVAQTYETAVTFDVVKDANNAFTATGKMVPEVAKGFSLDSTGSKYTFALRDGVTFSNGSPVTADALVYSYKRALEKAGVSALMMGLLGVKDASQFRAVDAHTFELDLGKPNPMAERILPLTVLTVLDPKASAAQVTPDDPWATKYYRSDMLGTGPYQKGSTWQPGNQYLFEPNPKYWDKSKVLNSGVLMKYIPNAEDRMLLLQRGELDVAFGLPSKDLATLRSDKSVKLWQFSVPSVNYLAMNSITQPFGDKRVRQAIAYAIPYDSLLKNALYGFGRKINSVIPTGMPTSQDTWTYKTDVAKAKSLLADAGLAAGFRTTLGVSISRSEDQDAAVWIQSALGQVGIQVDIAKLSEAEFRSKQAADQLPMFIDYWYSWVNDPYYQLFFLLHSTAKGTNLTHYNNPEVDRLITDGTYMTNETQRAANSQRVQQIFAEDVPRVLLYQEDTVWATRSGVAGINLYPDRLLRFWELSK